MNNKLRVTFKHLPENLPHDFSKNSAWGRCEWHILNSENQPEKLLTIEWHMLHIIKWLIYDYYPSVYEVYPELQLEETTAEAVNRIGKSYKVEDNISTAYFSRLQGFIKRHNLSYGFPSISTPNVFVAFDGKGEISHDPIYHIRQPHIGSIDFKMGKWSYPFDIQDFLEFLFEQLKNFLVEWEGLDKLLIVDVLKTDLMDLVNMRNKYRNLSQYSSITPNPSKTD